MLPIANPFTTKWIAYLKYFRHIYYSLPVFFVLLPLIGKKWLSDP